MVVLKLLAKSNSILLSVIDFELDELEEELDEDLEDELDEDLDELEEDELEEDELEEDELEDLDEELEDILSVFLYITVLTFFTFFNKEYELFEKSSTIILLNKFLSIDG